MIWYQTPPPFFFKIEKSKVFSMRIRENRTPRRKRYNSLNLVRSLLSLRWKSLPRSGRSDATLKEELLRRLLRTLSSGNYDIVGINPFRATPVPILSPLRWVSKFASELARRASISALNLRNRSPRGRTRTIKSTR